MQPVQDLTVEDRVSQTEYQYTLEDANADELNEYDGQDWWIRCRRCRNSGTWPPTSKMRARRRCWSLTASTASRLGITPTTIDNALYDAFGQRQISTLFTQLNQYHVILETLPDFQKNPSKLNDIYVLSTSGNAVPLSAFSSF